MISLHAHLYKKQVLLYTVYVYKNWFFEKEQLCKNIEAETLQKQKQFKNKLRLKLYQVWFIFTISAI